jgi:uncharacterized membrane protein
MDKYIMAVILWSFLFGLIIGVFIGQIEGIRHIIQKARQVFDNE